MKNTKFISVPEEGYQEIPDLKYYRTIEDRMYFDAIYYLRQRDAEERRSIYDFFERFGFQIDAMCDAMGLKREDMALVDEDTGNTMVFEALEFMFLCYVDNQYWRYFYERLRELHTLGFTVSDSYLAGLYSQRFQNEQ